MCGKDSIFERNHSLYKSGRNIQIRQGNFQNPKKPIALSFEAGVGKVFKEDIVKGIVAEGWIPLLAIDDYDVNCEMFKKMGIPTNLYDIEKQETFDKAFKLYDEFVKKYKKLNEQYNKKTLLIIVRFFIYFINDLFCLIAVINISL